MSSLISPDASSDTSEVAISDGGISTRWSIQPTRHASSSAAIAATMTMSLIRPTRVIPAAMSERPSDFSNSPRRLSHSRPVISPKAASLTMVRVALARPAGLDDLHEAAGTRRHGADAVGQHGRLVERVGDQQHGGAGAPPQPQHLVAHQQPRLRVERAERLVEQDEARLQHQGAGDADALAHAAGKLRRIGAGEVLQPHEGERIVDPAAHFGVRHAAAAQAEGGIVVDGQPGKAGVLLEDDADAVGNVAADGAAFEGDRALRSAAAARRGPPAASTCRSRTGRPRQRIRPA